MLGVDGITTAPADEIHDPVVELGEATWDDLDRLLWAGQNYE